MFSPGLGTRRPHTEGRGAPNLQKESWPLESSLHSCVEHRGGQRVSADYRVVVSQSGCPLFTSGQLMRGEFHVRPLGAPMALTRG